MINHHHKNQHPHHQDHHHHHQDHQFLEFSSLQLLSEQEPPEPPPFRSVTDTKTERAPQKLVVSKSLRSCTAFFSWLLLRTCHKLFGGFFPENFNGKSFFQKTLSGNEGYPPPRNGKSAKLFRKICFLKGLKMMFSIK